MFLRLLTVSVRIIFYVPFESYKSSRLPSNLTVANLIYKRIFYFQKISSSQSDVSIMAPVMTPYFGNPSRKCSVTFSETES